MKKRVFSVEKWFGSLYKDYRLKEEKRVIRSIINSLETMWPIKIDGLTEEEINRLGLETEDSWMIEIECED